MGCVARVGLVYPRTAISDLTLRVHVPLYFVGALALANASALISCSLTPRLFYWAKLKLEGIGERN